MPIARSATSASVQRAAGTRKMTLAVAWSPSPLRCDAATYPPTAATARSAALIAASRSATLEVELAGPHDQRAARRRAASRHPSAVEPRRVRRVLKRAEGGVAAGRRRGGRRGRGGSDPGNAPGAREAARRAAAAGQQDHARGKEAAEREPKPGARPFADADRLVLFMASPRLPIAGGAWRASPAAGTQREGSRFRAGQPRRTLSMRRVAPNRAASESIAGPSIRSSSTSVASSAQRDVLDGGARLARRARRRRGRGWRRRRAPRPPTRPGRPAGRDAGRGRGTLVGGEVDVAGRERQPVGLPDGRAAHHLGHAQVAGHPLDHPELLAVLLAEVGAVGSHDPEQDRDDGRDAGEVSRPRRALQRERSAARRSPTCRSPAGRRRRPTGARRGPRRRPRTAAGRWPRRAGTARGRPDRRTGGG